MRLSVYVFSIVLVHAIGHNTENDTSGHFIENQTFNSYSLFEEENRLLINEFHPSPLFSPQCESCNSTNLTIVIDNIPLVNRRMNTVFKLERPLAVNTKEATKPTNDDSLRAYKTVTRRDPRDARYHRNKSKAEQPMRVLMLHPIYAGSHEMSLRTLGEVLARAGHFVTQLRLKSSIMLPVNRSFSDPDEDGTTVTPRLGSMEVITIGLDNRNLR